MTEIYVCWGIAAALLVASAIALGRTYRQSWLGILIDTRGRYSLTHFQLVLWSLLVLSLIAGVVAGKLLGLGLDHAKDALNFTIPKELLGAMGISVGSAAAAVAVKSGKDAQNPQRIAASDTADKPRFSQVFLVEEGELADKVVDITKFQNFWFTIILVAAYIGLAISSIRSAGVALTALPGFDGTFLTLLGISHVGYIAGKMPARAGTPDGLTLAAKRLGATPKSAQAMAADAQAAAQSAPKYTPRNP
jgi:NAD/NADP transhydrogenase beta subunit